MIKPVALANTLCPVKLGVKTSTGPHDNSTVALFIYYISILFTVKHELTLIQPFKEKESLVYL